jgi:hypothetical protein
VYREDGLFMRGEVMTLGYKCQIFVQILRDVIAFIDLLYLSYLSQGELNRSTNALASLTLSFLLFNTCFKIKSPSISLNHQNVEPPSQTLHPRMIGHRVEFSDILLVPPTQAKLAGSMQDKLRFTIPRLTTGVEIPSHTCLPE